MGAGDMPDGVDHDHDHEPERDRHADVAERVRLLFDHDRAAAGEDERERPDPSATRLRARGELKCPGKEVVDQGLHPRVQLVADPADLFTSCPAGSSSFQSSYFLPG